jgi:type IV pilus assembly protein PilY1
VPTTVTLQISGSSDDVNQNGTSLASPSSTLWVGTYSSATSSYTGLRFNSVTIPAGATITSAQLEVFSSQTQWIGISLDLAAENIGNSPTFSTGNLPSQRALTAQTVGHSSNVQWLANTWYSLGEITDVIQSVIDRPDWQSGNSLSIILRGTGNAWGRKFVTSWDSSPATAPRLIITFSGGGVQTLEAINSADGPDGISTGHDDKDNMMIFLPLIMK